MKIRTVDSKLLESMLCKLQCLTETLEKSVSKNLDESSGELMTTEDVYAFLHIKSRALQNLRSSGELPYSKVGNMCFYHPSDVIKLIKAGN